MKNKLYVMMFITLAILMAGGYSYAGGDKRNGTGGATELLIPVGVRGIALGGASIADSRGIESLFWNPAGLAKSANSVEATFSYMSYIADMGLSYGAVSAQIEDIGVFSFSLKSLAMDEIKVTTSQNPDGTGKMFKPLHFIAGLSFSRALNDRITVGLTGNYINETIDRVSASGVAFNIGVMYDNLADINGLSIGLVMNNLGPEMKFEGSGLYHEASVKDFKRSTQYYLIDAASFELPSSLELGMAYKRDISANNQILLSSSFQNNNFSGDAYKLGAEYNYNDVLFVRSGYAYTPDSQEKENIYGISAGIGFRYKMQGTNMKFDYAFRDVNYFSGNHVFSMGIEF